MDLIIETLIAKLRHPLKSFRSGHAPLLDQTRALADMREAADAIERLQAQNNLFRSTLETIAGSTTDRLQAMQAKNALDNIGPPVES